MYQMKTKTKPNVMRKSVAEDFLGALCVSIIIICGKMKMVDDKSTVLLYIKFIIF